MRTQDFDSLVTVILQECQEDYVGLWSIVKQVRSRSTDKALVPELTLRIIYNLLVEHKVVAGEFKGQDFKAWNASPSAIRVRIQHAWDKLDRDPDVGEIVWLTAKT